MKSFNQYITEVLDKPLKWKEFIKQPTTREASFDVGEYNYIIKILISNKEIARKMGEKVTIGVEFNLGSEGGVAKGQGDKIAILNTGNAGAVFATVIDYVKYVVKKENVGTILFSGKEASRQKLYKTILKRMVKLGLIKGGFTQEHGSNFKANVDKVR